ncbi:MAG: FtsX-like permease family protein, partial [Bacteroidales bacterium]|nr:FtsX-like permease family protein [Bacteroidales bacterium]
MKNRHQYKVIPFKGSHLNASLQNDLMTPVAPVYLWILSAIAIGILVIACLNFINISIANSARKYLVSGIKKVHGASRRSLIQEIFAEMSFIVIISLLLALAGIFYFLPSFNTLLGKAITFNFTDPVLWFGLLLIGLFTIVFSSLYPALALSRPSPVKVMLNKKIRLSSEMNFQKGFVVLQFSITTVL